MITVLVNLLNNKKELHGWKINYTHTIGNEAYFIKNSLDMCRSKNVEKYEVTIYRKFEENENTYLGSYSFFVHPTMTENDILSSVDEAFYASIFVKNKYFPLVIPSDYEKTKTTSNFQAFDFDHLLADIAGSILEGDTVENSSLNSFEVFINKIDTRLITSTGIDYSSTSYSAMVEYIVNSSGVVEEIELYDRFEFATYDKNEIKNRIIDQLKISKDRGNAKQTPDLGKFNVILKDESVKSVLGYFDFQTNINSVYQKFSCIKLNQSIQRDDAACDRISLTKVPTLKNSTHSLPFDEDGVIIKPVKVIENGRVRNLHGSSKIAYYLNHPVVGIIPNCKFSTGSKSVSEFKKEPYLEVVSFSDLQVDHLVGTIGGEIRLAYYFDGKKVIPVTGGSVSGNILDIVNDLKLSSESVSLNNYEGPKYLLAKLIVSGNN